jgi:hypothetical protein
MKRMLPIFLLTVMLRVWWPAYSTYGQNYNAGSGIYLTHDNSWAHIRTDDGKIIIVIENVINKTKWVEVKAEKTK